MPYFCSKGIICPYRWENVPTTKGQDVCRRYLQHFGDTLFATLRTLHALHTLHTLYHTLYVHVIRNYTLYVLLQELAATNHLLTETSIHREQTITNPLYPAPWRFRWLASQESFLGVGFLKHYTIGLHEKFAALCCCKESRMACS